MFTGVDSQASQATVIEYRFIKPSLNVWASETEFTSFLSVDQCLPLDICFLLIVAALSLLLKFMFVLLMHKVLFHDEDWLVLLK